VALKQRLNGMVILRRQEGHRLQNDHSCVDVCRALSQTIHETIHGIHVDGAFVLSLDLRFVQFCGNDNDIVPALSGTDVDNSGKTSVISTGERLSSLRPTP
jgi:hypothetical protein